MFLDDAKQFSIYMEGASIVALYDEGKSDII